MNLDNLYSNANTAAMFMSALANQKRILILCNLVQGEIAVGALAEKVGLSQSALSQHLSKLKALSLVKTRRSAQTIYYSSPNPQVHTLLHTLNALYVAEADKDADA
ncbi:ArsR/SmtB family transcription factor [Rhizobium sp. C4]|uniref:ArsR/SmtB family transcription factor n=1 Tax=Rhizobium sp. C4 TaxID=1349800 RepID=UPI001E40EA2E|nr:metalloregulator ArsR/SmtB family transcription factor [Rhizobium sp. C4]MCD2173908.1 metalloregulator ArsR/SmtB family transcription factor [Rhizobium sp. C4]